MSFNQNNNLYFFKKFINLWKISQIWSTINFNRNDNIVNNYIDPFPYIGSTSAIFFDVNNYDILKSHINLNIEGHCSTSIYIVIQNI